MESYSDDQLEKINGQAGFPLNVLSRDCSPGNIKSRAVAHEQLEGQKSHQNPPSFMWPTGSGDKMYIREERV